jgi:ribosomal-protein-alanine N-acetyltransferase
LTLSIRDTVVDDLSEIFRIRTHELVRPHQYKIRAGDSIDAWRDRVSGDNRVGSALFKCVTIREDERIIGHVAQFHYERARAVQCGWDLDPQYWGRGIMTEALGILFDQFCVNDGISYVLADCFRSNTRCKRVLQKLGFVQVGIPFHHRVFNACWERCLHWIERYRLDAETWNRKV